MSDSVTNFPPETYSSIFNLNVMPEGEHDIVAFESFSENETKEAEKPRMRDCFSSSMGRKFFIITLMCCLVKTNAIYCTLDEVPRSRIFASLVEYQGNKLSFNRNDDAYQGNSVSFSFLTVDHLYRNTFISYTSENVTRIDLNDKSITIVEDGAFNSLTGLCELDLSNNLILQLTSDMFLDLINLRSLNIRNNHIAYIPSNVFSNLKGIEKLDISHNNISEMHKSAFDDIPTLETLNLSHNPMKHIRYSFFNNLIHLKELYLDHNSIAIVYTNLFSKNRLLEKLDLSGNGLVLLHIVKDSFNPDTMQIFNLSNNYLMDLNVNNIVDQFCNAKTVIDLNDNQFYCDEWEEYMRNFTKNNVTLAPGRNFTAKRHIYGMACDNLNFTLTQDFDEEIESLNNDEAKQFGKHTHDMFHGHGPRNDNLIHTKGVVKEVHEEPAHLSYKYVIIALTVIGSAFCVFLTLDYALGVGFSQRLTHRVRACLSPASQNSNSINSDYVQLQPAS